MAAGSRRVIFSVRTEDETKGKPKKKINLWVEIAFKMVCFVKQPQPDGLGLEAAL